MARPEREAHDAAARRMRAFQLHLAGFVTVGLILGLVNFLSMPGQWWFLFFVVGWGAPLAVHVAWVMGLFGGPRA